MDLNGKNLQKHDMFLQKWNPEEWIDVEGTTHFTDVTKTLTPLHKRRQVPQIG